MSTKAKCEICGKVLDNRGIKGHVKFAHPAIFTRNLVNIAETSENAFTEISENADARFAEKDSSIAQLREEVTDKQTDLEVSQIRIAELEASLEKLPTSIGDFPAAEQAAYFTEFLKNLSSEEKAALAEETGFGIAMVEKPKKIVLTFNHKQLGYIKS